MTIELRDHQAITLWACDCAEHVLPYFEQHGKGDRRPRNAIEAGRAWVRGEIKMADAREAAFAAHAAAREMTDKSAQWAARSAGHAAATVHVYTHAPHAANYAKKSAGLAQTEDADQNSDAEALWQRQRISQKHAQILALK